MTVPSNAAWQDRVLTDQELTGVLASLSSMEAMSVLQRQLELRAQNRGDVSRDFDESFELSQAITVVPEVQSYVPEPVVEVDPVAPAAPVASPTGIADSLNALFAARQHVSFEPQPALTISQVSPNLVQAASVPVESPSPEFAAPAKSDAYPATEPGFLSSRAFAPVSPTAPVGGDIVPSFSNPVPVANPGSLPSPTEIVEPEVSTLEQPAVELPSPIDQPAQTDLPSAEEAVTAFEETYLTEAQPTLVDDVILAVGGLEDSEAIEEPALPNGPVASVSAAGLQSSVYRNARSLLATWNGTGMLLVVACLGFVAAQKNISLVTAVSGAFAALVMSGFGFGAAALSARRGRQPQAVLSRAVFGVNGAAVPLTVVIIARLTATATISILAGQALLWFFPAIPAQVSVSGSAVSTTLLIAVGLLFAALLLAGLPKALRYVLVTVFAWTSVLGAATAVAAGLVIKPSAFQLAGSFDFAGALAIASTILILLGLIWGTSAADESVDLAPTTAVPKLLAASLLSFTAFGLLALLAGFAFSALAPASGFNLLVGSIFAVIIAISLANQVRRSTDAFRGFGLQKTRWWLLVLVVFVVIGAAIALQIWIPANSVLDGFRGILPVIGVPVLAWLSSIGIDSVLRTRDYHEVSLVRNYGFYGKVRFANLIGWIVATAVGWGFISSTVAGFGWLGYFATLFGTSQVLVQANLGLWLAIAIGLVTPALFTIGAIRQQEAESDALDQRHEELINVLGISE